MAQRFKHKETGEVVTLSRVRYFVDGKPPVDLSGQYDLSQYVEYTDENEVVSYDSIKAVKSFTDGAGIR